MTKQLYEWMTPQQAADALEEYLAERGPILEHLRCELAGRDLDSDGVPDGGLDSIAPVWEWITERATELGVDPRSVAEDPTRPGWPSWTRHGMLVDSHPLVESLVLVDRFASYLGRSSPPPSPRCQ